MVPRSESLPTVARQGGVAAFNEGTEWMLLDTRLLLSERVVHELLEGGQTFAWDRLSGQEPTWQGVVGCSLLQVRCGTDGMVYFRTRSHEEFPEARAGLARLLRLDEDADQWLQGLPVLQDDYLRRCIEAFPGLRILCQPIGEVLLSFLCSSNKHVTQIKRMIRRICLRWGEPLAEGYACFPGWKVLAWADDAELRACGTGYRSKYILGTAKRLSEDPDFLERVHQLPYEAARTCLMELPGVGSKVADCILLYGGGRYEAFPLDTWLLKALVYRYGCDPKNAAAMHTFASEHFGPNAGIAQQYIFAYERDVQELTKRVGPIRTEK